MQTFRALVEDIINSNSHVKENEELLLAIQNHDNKRAVELIQSGADVNYKDDGYIGDEVTTPLGYAAYFENDDMLKYLLDNGANVNENPEALLWAVETNNYNAVKLLIDYGADIFAQDPEGTNAFDIAKHSNNKEILSLLKSYARFL